jgi:hypothetical protein
MRMSPTVESQGGGATMKKTEARSHSPPRDRGVLQEITEENSVTTIFNFFKEKAPSPPFVESLRFKRDKRFTYSMASTQCFDIAYTSPPWAHQGQTEKATPRARSEKHQSSVATCYCHKRAEISCLKQEKLGPLV